MDGFWSLGPFLIPITAIAGGILAGIVATVTRARVRELEIRERIADDRTRHGAAAGV